MVKVLIESNVWREDSGSIRGGYEDLGGEFDDVASDSITASTLNHESDDTIILLIGQTGTGKTSFIYNATGNPNAKIGEELESETSEISQYDLFVDGHRVVLVDTPGFDDTEIPDADIFRNLAEWLAKSYKQGKLIAGIIYFQRITDNRLSKNAKRNIFTFKDICGEGFMENVMLLSTLWARDGAEREKQARREDKYRENGDYWKSMLDQGAKTDRYRHYDPHEFGDAQRRAHEIISKILDNQPQTTRIQQEMVDEERKAHETTAGIHLVSEIDRLQEKFDRLIHDLEEKANKSERDREQYKAKLDDLQRQAREAETQSQKLHGTYKATVAAAIGAVVVSVAAVAAAALSSS
ncbi:hypothetical protein TWF594_005690 [Orbilia oligospora]|nr:hypothetical protein TWF706_004240 [Orbilia oligospora]KAF3151930.1 hypothetical protein TWF594_005690 [Orbilia oligospora]